MLTPLTPTRARHGDTQLPVWKGLQNGTGHTGGGTRRVWSQVTDGYNTDGFVLTQPDGLKGYSSASRPSSSGRAQGVMGFGVARPTQRLGYQVHLLPRYELGELQD